MQRRPSRATRSPATAPGSLVGNGPGDFCVVTAQYDDLSGNTTAGVTNNQTDPRLRRQRNRQLVGQPARTQQPLNRGGNGASASSSVVFSPWIGAYSIGSGPGFQPTGITLEVLAASAVQRDQHRRQRARHVAGRHHCGSIPAVDLPIGPSPSTSARRASRQLRWRRPCRQLRCRSTSRRIPSRGSPACRWW